MCNHLLYKLPMVFFKKFQTHIYFQTQYFLNNMVFFKKFQTHIYFQTQYFLNNIFSKNSFSKKLNLKRHLFYQIFVYVKYIEDACGVDTAAPMFAV
jgi:hypothetical protein